MARSIDTIKQSILDAKASESSLNVLTSTSATAIWKLLVGIFAQAANLLESLWDAKAQELKDLAAAAIPGSESWYASKVKEWQYGYALTVLDGQLTYLDQDESAQLVEAVAVVPGSPLLFKVAKDNSGTLVPLTSAERTSLDSYIRDIKFAGTDHQLISIDPDEVLPDATCYYDGKLDLTAVKTSVETALNTFLKEIYFDGKLNINRYRDAAEAVEGVIDFHIATLKAKPSGGTYSILAREYSSAAGYFKHDALFATGISYVAQ